MSSKHFDEDLAILGRDLDVARYDDAWIDLVHLIVLHQRQLHLHLYRQVIEVTFSTTPIIGWL